MAASAMDDIDYYAVLEVKQEATLQEIKSAYRQRSLKVHPDRVSLSCQHLPAFSL